MATIGDYYRRFHAMNNGFKGTIESALKSVNLSYYIREQLYSGLDGNENELRPSYMDDPYFRERTNSEEKARNMARWYVKHKELITPPLTSNIGFKARGKETPNLIIRGDFYESIISTVDNWRIKIETQGVSFGADVERKYGSQIFALSEKSKRHIIETYIKPAIADYLKVYGLR